eukprot:g374.t1
MNLRLAFLVAFVVFVATPSLEFIGARAQTPATEEQCDTACNAAVSGNPSVLQGLINQNVRLCDCICDGNSGTRLLTTAVVLGCDQCINLLTTAPSSCACDSPDSAGNTPFHVAAMACSNSMTSRAISAGCDINARNNDDFTPLCLVSRNSFGNQCAGVVTTLLGAGATPCLTCSGGTACEICGFFRICNALEDEGACNCR